MDVVGEDREADLMENKITSIRDELCRFIRLNEQEQWVPSGDALEELERFGDDLIPGLVRCLEDRHPDVRCLSVKLLGAALPRSNAAVPKLVERLTDEDWLVIATVTPGYRVSDHLLLRQFHRSNRGWNRQASSLN